MFIVKKLFIKSHEKGFYFHKGEFKGTLEPGTHWFFDILNQKQVEISSMRDPWVRTANLDLVIKGGGLGEDAKVINLDDSRRALVWVEGRLKVVLGPGLYAVWTRFWNVKVETAEVNGPLFNTPHTAAILKTEDFSKVLDVNRVPEGYAGVYFRNGEYESTLKPGQWLFWKNAGQVLVEPVDLREKQMDIAGQEIMTADKVTLRINATMAYRVTDPVKAVSASRDAGQSLYREAQLALREAVGAQDLDGFLSGKEKLSTVIMEALKAKAAAFGMEAVSFGVRDIILPGDMKELMNKVTEARKAAEANLITKREETAAMRSQANTARMLEENPALMRLRELEALERIAGSTDLKVVLGEKGLAERVMNLL